MKLYQCIAVDYKRIYVLCPNKECKEHIHYYASNRNLKDRVLIMRSRCKSDLKNRVKIRIDETTMRTSLTYYKNRSITLSKRKFIKQEKEFDPSKVDKGKIKMRNGKFEVKFK